MEVQMIDYSPLWKTMQARGYCEPEPEDEKSEQFDVIDNRTLDALKKGRNITLLTLEKLCAILRCTPNDVVRFTSETGQCPGPPP